MIVDIGLSILAIIALVLGFIGCVIPVIPGPILAYLGLILLSIPEGFSLYEPLLLAALALAVLAAQFLDNLFPVLASKKAGAGKAGIWGSVLGMLIGMIVFPPWGTIPGAFLGAYMGEALFNKENENPMKAALGVFTGTLLGILLKLVVCIIIAVFMYQGMNVLFS